MDTGGGQVRVSLGESDIHLPAQGIRPRNSYRPGCLFWRLMNDNVSVAHAEGVLNARKGDGTQVRMPQRPDWSPEPTHLMWHRREVFKGEWRHQDGPTE
jgi:hypothetical protein